MTDTPERSTERIPGRPGWLAIGVPAALSVFLIAVSFHNFLLFHSLAELFAVGVAVLMAVVAWQSYPFSRNGFLMFLACGFFWIGATDLIHTLIYKGMRVYGIDSANPATQLWLVARYGQALLMLTAPVFARREVPRWPLFGAFGGVFALGYFLVISGVYPDAFIDGVGLTPFKVVSEYVIIALLAAALVHHYLRRAALGRLTTQLMALSIVLTIGSELAFTFYVSVYGTSLLIGHIFKLFAFWLIFEAVVRDSLVEPYRMLEARVRQRTEELEQEVAKRQKAERDIRRSEAWLRAVIDNSPDMISVKDCDGRYLLVNKEFERFWGRKRSEILGRSPEEVLSADAAENMRMQHGEIVRTGRIGRWEHEDRGPDGRPYDLTTVRFPIYDPAGQIVAVGNVTSDVTERKRAEEQLQHSRKLQAVGELAGGISHEINNLLVPVVTLSNALIKRIPPDDPNYQPLTLINDAGLRVRDIVAQVLAFSRQEDVEQAEVDIGGILQVPLELIRSTLPSSAHLILDVPSSAGKVLADAGQLATVLVNLVSNAADALEGRVGEVAVSLEIVDLGNEEAEALGTPRPGRFARLRVTDTGNGMDGETARRIFDPFFSTKEVGKGTGLGLSIVHGIVTAHNGSLDVASTPGAGTRVDVYIPMAGNTETGAKPLPENLDG